MFNSVPEKKEQGLKTPSTGLQASASFILLNLLALISIISGISFKFNSLKFTSELYCTLEELHA